MLLLICILFGSLILHVASFNNSTVSICDILSSSLPNSIFLPETPTYNASISSYPFVHSRLHPTCIVRPKTPQDIADTVHLLRKSSNTKFAVKGGGHNANTGFNNVEDGVTIDMQSLNTVEITNNGSIVQVGAGALWQDVYDVVEKRNKTVLGGRIGVVGVGGFTTGGGLSFLSPQYGWSCDSVINFEIALANGTIINANATFNMALFMALKGGQSNFGIVTRFDFKTFPASLMWGGRIIYAPEAEIALLSGLTEWKVGESTGSRQYDPYAAGWLTFTYNGSTGTFIPSTILWHTRPERKPGALGLLTDVEPKTVDGMTVGTVTEFARNGSLAVKATSRHTIWATTTFYITPRIAHRIHALWKSLIPNICTTYAHASPTSDLTFQSLPPPYLNNRSPNSLGFLPTSTPHKDLIFLQIVFHFKDSNATQGLQTALKDFIRLFEELAEEDGARVRWKYLNFAAAWQDPLGGYGDEVLRQLRTTARAYDPKGLFQKQLNGGFKLF